MSQSSLPNQENRFHFVVSHAGSSHLLDKSARRFLVNGAAQAKCRKHEGPRNGQHSGFKRRHTAKLGFSMNSWRVKTGDGNPQRHIDRGTEMTRYDKHSNSETATSNRFIEYYLPEPDGLHLQVPSNPSYGAEPWAAALFNYYFHMMVMWRYPVKFRCFSDLYCPPYAQQEASYSLHDRSNFFTTLAVASSHLQMYKRELGFDPFSNQLGLIPFDRFAYYRIVSLETIRHDVCNYNNMRAEDKAALIWAVCKMAHADLFCNDFEAAKIHLMAIARIIRHAGEWPRIEEYQKHMLFIVDVNTAAMFLENPLFPASFQQRNWDEFKLTSLPALCGRITSSTLASQFLEERMSSALGEPFLQMMITQLHHIIVLLEYLTSIDGSHSKPEYVEWATYTINAMDHEILSKIASFSELPPGSGGLIRDIQEGCLISILCLNFTIVKPASCYRGIKLAYFLMRSLSKVKKITHDPRFRDLYLWMACMGACVTPCPTQRSYLLKLLGKLALSLRISCWTDFVCILKGFFYIEHIHGPRIRSLFEKTIIKQRENEKIH